MAEATAYVTDLARKRGLSAEVCAEALLSLLLMVQMALALPLECAIWTTNTVERYLES